MTDTLDAMMPWSALGLTASGLFAPVPADGLAAGTTDLVASARVINSDTDNGVRWISGFEVVGDTCLPPGLDHDCSNHRINPGENTISHYSYQPYSLWAQYGCSTFGRFTPAELKQGARRILASGGTSYSIEHELAYGTLATIAGLPNPSFATATQIGTGPYGLFTALAALESAARQVAPNLGRYMIHANPGLASLWSHMGTLRKVGNLLLTYLDTVVVSGGGYRSNAVPAPTQLLDPTPGAQPVPDPMPTTSLAWITGMVTVRLGQIVDLADDNLIVDCKNTRIT